MGAHGLTLLAPQPHRLVLLLLPTCAQVPIATDRLPQQARPPALHLTVAASPHRCWLGLRVHGKWGEEVGFCPHFNEQELVVSRNNKFEQIKLHQL